MPTDLTTHRTAPDRCPECGHLLDAATNTEGPGAPGPGDFSVCISCTAILVFDEQRRLRLPTRSEREDMPDEVLRVVKTIAMVNAGRRG